MDKFILKNQETINELNSFVNNNSEDIRFIIASVEMFIYLQNLDGCEIIDEEMDLIKYLGKRVIRDIYLPANTVGFMLKSQEIKFNTPCLCGIYKDEIHP